MGTSSSAAPTADDIAASGDQSYPSVTGLADGGWAVVWQFYNSDHSGSGVYLQRFDASGSPVGAATRLDDPHPPGLGSAYAYLPRAQGLPDGGIAVSWNAYERLEGDDYAWGVVTRRVEPDGRVVTDPDLPEVPAFQNELPMPDGGMLRVGFGAASTDGAWFDIVQVRLDADGNPVGESFRVNTYTEGYQNYAVVAGLDDGGWVVAWTGEGSGDGDFGVYQQRFDAQGAPVGEETRVNSFTMDSQLMPSVAALTDGGWVVSWMSFGQDGDGWGVYQQRYGADGQPVGPETGVISGAGTPTIDTSSVDPQSLHMGTDQGDTMDGSARAEMVIGNAGDDSLGGGGGDDSLAGGSGRDSLEGGDGDDVVDAGSGDDLIVGGSGAGDDVYFGGSGVDTVRYTSAVAGIRVDLQAGTAGSRSVGDGAGIGSDLLDGIENVIAGRFSDLLTGDALDNQLRGLGGRDELRGGAGNDRLLGGSGADTIVGGLGRDQLHGGAGSDVFLFGGTSESGVGAGRRDLIVDFADGDVIDLSRIDAMQGRSADDAFTLLDAAPRAGQANGVIWFADGVLYGSTDDDTAAEFAIALRGVAAVSVEDFIL